MPQTIPFTTFSLPAGTLDHDSFTITNGNELHMGGAQLSVGSYDLQLCLSDGSSTHQHNFTIAVVNGTSQPQLSVGAGHNIVLDNSGNLYS